MQFLRIGFKQARRAFTNNQLKSNYKKTVPILLNRALALHNHRTYLLA